ncbi:hypothetical protein [Nocardiopsis coralliicola]
MERQSTIRSATRIKQPCGAFADLAEWDGRVEDPRYIDGVIEVAVDGRVLIGDAEWDLVDQLWAYILTMLEELRTSCTARTLFPDQPLPLEFRRVKGGLLVAQLDSGPQRRTVRAGEEQFVRALLDAAEEFFLRLEPLLPQNQYGRELRRIGRLRA